MEQQPELWREEAEQMKRDLAGRKKEVRRREVPIQFGKNTKSAGGKASEKPADLSDRKSDDLLRKRLGI